MSQVIRRHGRLADLIAVAQPDHSVNLGTNTLKAALFRSGRPVLMCPKADAVPKAIGAHISLAWNGSAEAARALDQSLSLLRAADVVTVLSNGEDSGAGTTVEDLLTYLSQHGVNAALQTFAKEGHVGEALLEESQKVGADLLVMGAYGDSHERETVFGGNTQTVVDHATMPVLMSH